MLKLAIGAVLAAVAMFFWGFAYWGSGLVDPFAHMTVEAQDAVTQAFTANLTADGVYFIPESQGVPEDQWAARMAAGPIAMFNYKSSGAAPMTTTMGLGFAHMLLTALLIGAFLRYVTTADTYLARFKLVVCIGFIAAVFTHLGQPIWWHYPWAYSLLGAIYDFGGYVIAGAVLAYFVSPAKA